MPSSVQSEREHLFYEQYKNSPSLVRAWLRQGTPDQANEVYEIFHAIKGVSDILGFTRLGTLATRVCTHKELPPKDEVTAALEELERTLETIEKIIDSSNNDEYEKMKQLIRQRNISALKLAHQWQASFGAKNIPEGLRQLVSCLESFDFKAASAYLKDYPNLNKNNNN
ncbi:MULTISPECIES: Hpt domain-containing protein [Gammaproteobacteria]|uniref:Hpt domain-containing protein n=1 Tax=Gammaproteobacteria TaxID=1236 RepID=UPI000DD06CFC|nr:MULTISPECIES: Hpt domain-containing protein [Gammaproteobacteria]RTE86238.1 hypothetical protein DQX04_06615 [Aliidiomarina sp. B3213]TCZ91589.1 hypothetical protein EYQ95_06625 [Lysobacter sp. N42]